MFFQIFWGKKNCVQVVFNFKYNLMYIHTNIFSCYKRLLSVLNSIFIYKSVNTSLILLYS